MLEKETIKLAVNAILSLRKSQDLTSQPTSVSGVPFFRNPLIGPKAAVVAGIKFDPQNVFDTIQSVFNNIGFDPQKNHSPEEIQSALDQVYKTLMINYKTILDNVNPQIKNELH